VNYRSRQTCLYSLLYCINEINTTTWGVILAWTASSRAAAWWGDIGCGESESLSITMLVNVQHTCYKPISSRAEHISQKLRSVNIQLFADSALLVQAPYHLAVTPMQFYCFTFRSYSSSSRITSTSGAMPLSSQRPSRPLSSYQWIVHVPHIWLGQKRHKYRCSISTSSAEPSYNILYYYSLTVMSHVGKVVAVCRNPLWDLDKG